MPRALSAPSSWSLSTGNPEVGRAASDDSAHANATFEAGGGATLGRSIISMKGLTTKHPRVAAMILLILAGQCVAGGISAFRRAEMLTLPSKHQRVRMLVTAQADPVLFWVLTVTLFVCAAILSWLAFRCVQKSRR